MRVQGRQATVHGLAGDDVGQGIALGRPQLEGRTHHVEFVNRLLGLKQPEGREEGQLTEAAKIEVLDAHHRRGVELGLKDVSFDAHYLTPADQRAIIYEPCEKCYSARGLRLLSRSLARLDAKRESFVLVDHGGNFILKPPSPPYPKFPENEDLTMRLATAAGIEVPLHGLVYASDGSRTYFIRRFDRVGRGAKLTVEDFAQLSGGTRQTKYDSSMEQVVLVIEGEELALPLQGKRRDLKRSTFVTYFAKERLGLTDKVINQELDRLKRASARFGEVIGVSFLSTVMQERYVALLGERRARLFE